MEVIDESQGLIPRVHPADQCTLRHGRRVGSYSIKKKGTSQPLPAVPDGARRGLSLAGGAKGVVQGLHPARSQSAHHLMLYDPSTPLKSEGEADDVVLVISRARAQEENLRGAMFGSIGEKWPTWF